MVSPATSPNISPPKPGLDRSWHTHEQGLSNRARVSFPNPWPAGGEGVRSSGSAPHWQHFWRNPAACFHPRHAKRRFGHYGSKAASHCCNCWAFSGGLHKVINEAHLNFTIRISYSGGLFHSAQKREITYVQNLVLQVLVSQGSVALEELLPFLCTYSHLIFRSFYFTYRHPRFLSWKGLPPFLYFLSSFAPFFLDCLPPHTSVLSCFSP